MHRGISTSFSDAVLVTCKHFVWNFVLVQAFTVDRGISCGHFCVVFGILSSSLKEEHDAETLLSLGQNFAC